MFKPKHIFIIAFVIAVLFQSSRWIILDIVDGGLWAHQAMYVVTHNPDQFRFDWAYGHPGGTLLLPTIALHFIFHITYYKALIITLTLLDSLVAAAICTLCFILRGGNGWWISSVCILALNVSFNESTPPSALGSLLFVLLCIVTLYIYERPESSKKRMLIYWSVISGLVVATRFDIGSIVSLTTALLLWYKTTFKKVVLMSAGAFVVFCISDPYMWYIPFQHIKDLFFKITYHYADYYPSVMTFETILHVSLLTFISMFIALMFGVLRKKVTSPLPLVYMYVLFFMTVILYTIFLTARYKATRYFQPMTLLWETFLPLFVFTLIENISFDFLKNSERQILAQKITKVFFISLIWFYHVYFLFYLINSQYT